MIIRKLIAVLAVSFTVITSTAFAQGLATFDELRKVTDGVMLQVGSGDIEGGFKNFKHLTIIPEAEFEALVAKSKAFLPMMALRFGGSIGHEFLKEEKLGNSLVRLVYINKFEKHAMVWNFYCYKGKNGWVINTFKFDDNWPGLF